MMNEGPIYTNLDPFFHGKNLYTACIIIYTKPGQIEVQMIQKSEAIMLALALTK